ncbi:uncharacterized protein LOC110935668 [Helianthus annuus]|uniref:uncharacterized protein LOC110935668 n=1 Tax=Helianthus annuus TaxID=4232 RepID=UPI000B904633|nr:uncharacterized protein LOC110935668 [Helianthus annuus]
MASPSVPNTPAPMNSIMHMIALKLTPTNYLYRKNQMIPLFNVQNLSAHINGSDPPNAEIVDGDKRTPNPLYVAWQTDDQKAVMLLNASLTEEVLGEVIGLPTAYSIWQALEQAFSNTSVDRIQNLRDQLRLISKGTSTVADFGRRFKHIVDQLTAVGQPVDDAEKSHLFLRGLGPGFEMFSTATRTVKPLPSLRDIITQAESYEQFHSSIHGTGTPPVAFNANRGRGNRSGGRGYRGSASGGRGRGSRRPPHCQLCRENGHYASACPRLSSFAASNSSTVEDIAKAFHATCNINRSTPDWFVADTSSTDHMVHNTQSLQHSSPYGGDNKVTFGSGPGNEASSSTRKV